MNRIIGKFKGESQGPLVLCLGGVHGNEPAGVQALELIFKMLAVEPITNPDFKFRGTLMGIIGNLGAMRTKERFIERDLNRMLTRENVDRILGSDPDQLKSEDLELFQFISLARKEIEQGDNTRVIVLDLHTTTATGGIFVLASKDSRSIDIGIEMHAPVITGLAHKVTGTTMEYFDPANFEGRDVLTVVFESGQHLEELSVNRAIAGVINVLRTVGCVEAEDVENRHDYLLREYSKGLPKVAELLYRYQVDDPSNFSMGEGYENFQPVNKGQILAYHNKKAVCARDNGLLLMPKYQQLGNDGFFLVKMLDY